ncbi:MAG TPA: histone deacetylase, partial [Aggregicoccus sp.]|nr:histone deacetylase [Aggregicoccus sp.]
MSPWLPPETPSAALSRVLRRGLTRLLPGTAPRLPVFYDEAYRLPLNGLEASIGIELRTVDFTAWYLLETGVLRPEEVRRPERISWEALARVHTEAYLESLGQAETLARIYAVEPSDVVRGELLHTVRLACGGTLAAARVALFSRGPALNLAGGFHHAAPSRGGGFCVVNDIAVAVAALRAEGLDGQVAVLDLDAHPPDGTAACLQGDARAWVGSLSGSDWGALPGVDETRLPEGCDDPTYLKLLAQLLERMPTPELAFVIAGGDVLAGDRFGRLGMTLDGARQRDLLVAAKLAGIASVWLPGGGYHPHAWKVLAGTALALAGRGREPIRARYDPLSARYQHLARLLRQEAPAEEALITLEELEGTLRLDAVGEPLLLGHYSAQGLEYILFRYGLLTQVERLGYSGLRVELSGTGAGTRAQLLGRAEGKEHVLIDCVLERHPFEDGEVLFVNWLSLRHPRAHFSPVRPQLPGQDAPGLGLSREMDELLALLAERQGLLGVAFRPMWFHLAALSRRRYRFVDSAR